MIRVGKRAFVTISVIAVAGVAMHGLAAEAAHQQRTPPVKSPTGLVIGRIVDADGNAPITGAVVSLSGSGTTPRRVIVDAQGRFMFTGLPAGAFTIAVSKRGYLAGAFGQQRPDGVGRPLHLQDGERVTDATIRMWRFASISGTVTDDTGEAVSGATVQVFRRTITAGHWRLTPTGRNGSTDERGAYRVISLVPGDYALVITSLTSTLPSALLRMATSVQAMDETTRADFQRVTLTNGTAGFANDLQQGFATVRVGDLLLQGGAGPTINDGRTVNVFPTVWYPSAPTPSQATLITLGAGDHRANLDLRTTLTATKRISGTVTGPDGLVPWLSLRLVPAALDDVAAEVSTSLAASFNTAMASTDGNGAFTFLAVPPGQYIIRALTTPRPLPEPPAASTVIRTADGMSQSVANAPRLPPLLSKDPTFWVSTPVSVGDEDVTDLALTLQPALRVMGRVEFSGTSAAPTGNALRAIRLSVEPAEGRSVWYPTAYQVQVSPTGEAYSAGLTAGRYLLRVEAAPAGWSLKSAMAGGRDIADTPLVLDAADVNGLVVTFTDQPSRLTGTVRDDQSRPDDDAAVIVFPSDGTWTNLGASARRLRLVRPSRAGLYTVTGLPPGRYDVVAISDALVNQWQDPAFLKKLSRVATGVTIIDGQSQSLDLTTMVVR